MVDTEPKIYLWLYEFHAENIMPEGDTLFDRLFNLIMLVGSKARLRISSLSRDS